MTRLGLETEVVDRAAYERALRRCREAGVVLPTFAELSDPLTRPAASVAALETIDPDAPAPANLFRVHWHNAPDRRGRVAVPQHLELPSRLTGVAARIVLLLGDAFPMIRAHKVLAAYGCLAPRLVTGQFDPTAHRAIWPSTGNYCRGGVAISRLVGCHGVAVLPAGMSRERFDWLARWVASPEDIIRTPGSESNVKEIYDRCAELERSADNVVFNQFSEFGNYLVHFTATGRAAERVYEELRAADPELRLGAWVSASGSAGTLAAGDYLKARHGARVVVAEALECPTLLYNGFGEHNIQGIGDKHVPLIHNVMNTDAVTAVSDRSTDALGLLFNRATGRDYLLRAGVAAPIVEALPRLGLSSICNLLAAIKTAKHYGLGEDDLVLSVATDSAELYASGLERIEARDHPDGYDELAAARDVGRHLLGTATDHYLELTHVDRQRLFNLGYFTWVEQQGVSIEDFVARREERFWRELRRLPEAWDELITEFNERAAG